MNLLRLRRSLTLVVQSKAATFERGRVLNSLVLALEKHIEFAENKGREVVSRFPDLLFDLIAGRPSIFAETIEAFHDLRSLVVRIVYKEFERYSKKGKGAENGGAVNQVRLRLKESDFIIPSTLLQSITILLSVWNDTGVQKDDEESRNAMEKLVDGLLKADSEGQDTSSEGTETGLTSASMVDSGTLAVSVELVSGPNDLQTQ